MLDLGFSEFLYWGFSLSFKLKFSLKWRGNCVQLGVVLLHRHRAIVWYAFGVAWLNSRGGVVLKSMLCAGLYIC